MFVHTWAQDQIYSHLSLASDLAAEGPQEHSGVAVNPKQRHPLTLLLWAFIAPPFSILPLGLCLGCRGAGDDDHKLSAGFDVHGGGGEGFRGPTEGAIDQPLSSKAPVT